MKSFQISLLVFACLLCNTAFSQQITVDGNISPQQLIENNLIQGCVETSNINSPINGYINGFSSYGYFERGSSKFPFKNGIVLSTGNVTSGGNGTIKEHLNDGRNDWKNDIDLETALGITNTLNATALEFDFSSISNQIQFNYILASEEYYSYYPCEISDGFAFLIKEAGTDDPYVNIALIPGTSTPVNTNTIHNGISGYCGASNGEFFEGYGLGDTNYNGRTKVMTATANILPNVTYHIKLVIADYRDSGFDSAVFIEGNSFTPNVDLGEDITTCADEMTITGDINNPSAIYSWFFNDKLISDKHESKLVVDQSGTYTVKIQIPISNDFCLIEDRIEVMLSSTQTVAPITDFELCDDLSSDGLELFDLNLKTADILKSVPNSNYNISYHFSYEDVNQNIGQIIAPIQNSSTDPTIIHVRIEDTNTGCLAFSTFHLVVNPLPNIPAVIELVSCADALANDLTSINLSEKNDEITNGDSKLIVTYYKSQNDAATGSNSLPSLYKNNSRNELLYIRVENSLTGCAVTSLLNLIVLSKPIINIEPHYIDACDKDFDGFATFDLTSITADVLKGLTGVSTSFHITYEEALSASNPIIDPTNYINIKQGLQILYIRVTDDITGCSSVTPIEIHSNLLLTGTLIKDFSMCDIKDGEPPTFDMNDIEQEIVNKLPDVTVDFYETLADQSAQINAISKTFPFRPSSFPKTLYITLNSPTCTEIAEIQLIIDPVVDFPAIGSVTYCDTDQDLTTFIDLNTFSGAIVNGEEGYTVRYYKTEDDAKKDINKLPNLYENNAPAITVFTRTVSNATGCSDVKSLEIKVLPAPETNVASDIIICDDNQDGFFLINLNDKINEIVSDTRNRSITFHTSLAKAQSGTDAIPNATRYNAKTQTVYARVENINTGCFTVEPIKIIVNTLPVIPKIANYRYCEDDSDYIGDFVFQTKDAEILKGQPGKRVSYYLNQNDAHSNNHQIDKTEAFHNTYGDQTIFIRVENISDHSCYTTGSFTIEVGSNPKYNVPKDWFVCDDISNDSREIFDLTQIRNEISEGIDENLNITFYSSLGNAEKALNPIALQHQNTKNPQLIYARIENGSICAPITKFNIGVIKAPEANSSKPLEMCSTDGSDYMTFDLTLSEIDILDIRQYNLDVKYYANAVDAELGTNHIPTPTAYTNISNPQIVFLRVVDTKTGCYLSIPIDLKVNHPPKFNAIPSVTICANTTKYYDLKELNDLLIDNPVNIEISYYKSLEDALDHKNPLKSDYTYKTSGDTIYTRIENSITHCFSIHPLKLKVNPLPKAYTPPHLESCDDDFDGFYTFDLSQQDASVLKTQDPNLFGITYHKTQDDANTGEHTINTAYPAIDLQTIYVRIENNTTGCYSTTKFKTYVHPRPIVDIPDQVICERNGSLIVSANTHNRDDTYLWSTNATTSEIEITKIGIYWVKVTSIFNCETTQKFKVIESESATIEFTETVDFSDPNNITITISGIGNYMYVLDKNLPQESNVFQNVSIGPHLITVIDLNGCAEVTKAVIVIDTPKFMTPNGDGYFDTWHITGVETLSGTVITIYDRYGKQLARLTSTSQGWDGTHNGHNMPSSDYWFVAEVKKDNTSFQLKGHFALKR